MRSVVNPTFREELVAINSHNVEVSELTVEIKNALQPALCLLWLRKDTQAEQDLKKCFVLNKSLRPVFDPLVKEIKKARNIKLRK